MAKHLNFTKAAQECHIAQPAISRQMSSLEEELGFALFDRSSRKVRLTPAGQSFYTSMMRFVNDYDNGVEQLRHISEERMQMVVCTGALGISPLLSRTLGGFAHTIPHAAPGACTRVRNVGRALASGASGGDGLQLGRVSTASEGDFYEKYLHTRLCGTDVTGGPAGSRQSSKLYYAA